LQEGIMERVKFHQQERLEQKQMNSSLPKEVQIVRDVFKGSVIGG
jgi:hypothetical protein